MSTIALKSPSGTVNLIPEDIAGTHNVTIPSAGVGKVLQVKSFTKTDTFITSSTGFIDCGMSLAITPKSVSSKILVMVDLSMGANSLGSGFRISRDGDNTIAIGDAASLRPLLTGTASGAFTNITYTSFEVSKTFLDSPSTISEVVYSIDVNKFHSASVTVNRTQADRDTSLYEPRSISTITLMEIGA